MKFVRHKPDGTREVVIWSGNDAPIWLEGEPEWHFWLVFVTYCIVLLCIAVAVVVWAVITP